MLLDSRQWISKTLLPRHIANSSVCRNYPADTHRSQCHLSSQGPYSNKVIEERRAIILAQTPPFLGMLASHFSNFFTWTSGPIVPNGVSQTRLPIPRIISDVNENLCPDKSIVRGIILSHTMGQSGGRIMDLIMSITNQAHSSTGELRELYEIPGTNPLLREADLLP